MFTSGQKVLGRFNQFLYIRATNFWTETLVPSPFYYNRWSTDQKHLCHYICRDSQGRLGVFFLIHLLICWSSRMTAVLLCYHSIVPCISKSVISVSAILSSLVVILVYWSIGRSKDSCYCVGLTCNSSFYFVASTVPSTNLR